MTYSLGIDLDAPEWVDDTVSCGDLA